jgi:CubicO group peptidase (beta-lactamase class C family)
MRLEGMLPALLVLGLPALGQTVVDPNDAYDFGRVTQLLNGNLAAFSDNVVVLLERDGQELYRYEYGFTGDSVTGIASATKLISGSVVLTLRDDGWFALDDNVGRAEWVPLMAQQGKDFTIRQAFSMSSGLFSSTPYEWLPLYTLEQSVVQIALNVPQTYTPGTGVLYDGAGMQTVGLVAERATGLSWQAVAASQVLTLCEMDATSYTRFDPNPAIAGGVETSANDYMKLLRMIAQGGMYNGTAVLSPAAVEELFADQNGDNPILGSPFPTGNAWYPYGMQDVTYGFGAWVLAQHPVTGVIEEILSPGAWGTSPWVDRKRGVYGIVFTAVPAGSQQALEPTLKLLEIVRQTIDDADDAVVQVSVPGESYIDPELLSSENLLVFQDVERNVWLAGLESTVGLFADSTTGKDMLITDGAAPLLEFWNSAEFAREASGWSVYYNVQVNGSWRVARAYPDGNDQLAFTILTDDTADRGGMIVSDSPNLETSYAAYVKGSAQSGEIWWIDRRTPTAEQRLGPFVIGKTNLRWVPDQHAFVASQPDDQGVFQLYWVDAISGARMQITEGVADYTDPFLFHAPEYDGRLMLVATKDEQRVVVFGQTVEESWEQVAALEIPAASAYDQLNSPEVFAFRGRSYLSVRIASSVGQSVTPAEIWVFGISDNPYTRFTLRVDGVDGPEGVRRTDPEPYVGADDVFIYYNVVTPVYETWRARTNLKALALPVPGDVNTDGGVDGGDWQTWAACLVGPDQVVPPAGCEPFTFGLSDLDDDDDADLGDLSRLQRWVGV